MGEIKVLLVDDEQEFVDALAERIKMRELDSATAYDGEQALQLVHDDIPDVVVLDLRMPGIDGLEVLERLKKKYPQVQVIILTGHGTEKDHEISKKLGAYEYLQKPVSIDKLIGSIKNAYHSIEDTLSAATYAQAGDRKSAEELMEKAKQKKKKK